MPLSSLRIIVCGYVVRGPLGGLAWHHLQYVMGLADLGHDVWFLEDSGDYPACYDPSRQVCDADPSFGLDFARRAFDRIGLAHRWAYHDALGGGSWLGPAADRMLTLCRGADLMINVSGINPLRPWLRSIPRRVLLDTDPVFTQVDILRDPAQRAFAEGHDAFFTFAESFGDPACGVPHDGLPWRPTRQPVVMRAWPFTPGPADGRYTTVMQWDSYETREWRGTKYGMKSQEMERVLELPTRCGPRFELALGSPTAPHERLKALGWHIRNPLDITRDPWTYQDYLRGSKGEFSVAKHGYVASRSGWFSERSANYLALGRPVAVQDTGFTRHLPAGDGLLAFADLDGAVAAVAEIDRRYEHHCRAARELATAHFEAGTVLSQMIESAMTPAGTPSPGGTTP